MEEKEWFVKSSLMYNFHLKLYCCHLIDLAAYALLPNYRYSAGLWQYLWGHNLWNTKCCQPSYLFPARWLVELWRSKWLCVRCWSKIREQHSHYFKKQYSEGKTIEFFSLFFTDPGFLDQGTVSGIRVKWFLILFQLLIFREGTEGTNSFLQFLQDSVSE